IRIFEYRQRVPTFFDQRKWTPSSPPIVDCGLGDAASYQLISKSLRQSMV
uniref:Uncharacterized protein n=1 Tax=Cucumis melo TaxID=3656 RepID=A0A9I9E2W5_CUCME